MKIAIRTFVLGMLLTGFAANHVLASKAAPTTTTVMVSSSAVPAPSCNQNTACGLDF